MLNSYSNLNGNIKISAISGTVVKNYKDSFFKRFNLKSKMAEAVLDTENPHLNNNKPIVVLQMMMCGEMEVICEIMWKEDFDKLFNEEVKE